MLDILAWTYDKYPNEVFLSAVLVLGLVVALSLRQRFLIGSYLSTSQIPDFLHRDLKGKLCLVTNAFSSSESLALVDRLLARGAHLVLLCQPQDAKDPNVLQIYALLRHNHPSGITREVYIEPIDLYSRSSIQEFAQLFESKGSKRNGALGEVIGRTPIAGMICFQHPRHAGLDRSLELARLLIPTFQKSHKSENPDPVLQRGGGPADAQTRVIFVLNSIRYAAASAQRLLETSSQPQSVWQQQAADALKLAVLVNKAQSECMPPPAADVLFLSLSTGLTRQRVTATLPTFVSFLLYPIIWFFSKSSIEASLGIEWALTHPHLGSAPPALQIPPSKLVSPGVLYRDGVDAGSRLPELQDEDLKRKLWQGFTEQ